MLTPEEQKELESLEKEFGGEQKQAPAGGLSAAEQKELEELEAEFGTPAPQTEAKPASGLSAEEEKELEELEAEFGTPAPAAAEKPKPAVDEAKMAKVRAQLAQAKKDTPEAFTESGEVAAVETGPGLGEQAAGFVAGLGRGASMGLSDVAAGVGGALRGEGYEKGREEFQRQFEQLPETARTAGEITGAIGTGVGAGLTKQLAPLAQKAGMAGVGARLGIGAGEGAISGVAKEGLSKEAAYEAGMGALGAGAGEVLGAVGKKVLKPAVVKATEKATKKVDDIKKSLEKVWKDQGADGQYILDMMGESGQKFREFLGMGGSAARRSEVGPLKEKVLRQKMGKIASKLDSTIKVKSKELKNTYEKMYDEAYKALKGQPAKELGDLPGLDFNSMPPKIQNAWTDAVNMTDAADQARAIKEVRKQLRNLNTEQRSALYAAGQDPQQALKAVEAEHAAIPGLGEADQYYRQDMQLKDLVKSIGTKTQQGKRVITGETAKKLGGETEEKLAARAQELPLDMGNGVQEAGAEFRRAQEGLKRSPSIEEAQQRMTREGISPEERALEEIRLQRAQEERFGDVMHSDILGKPETNVRQGMSDAAAIATGSPTPGLVARIADFVKGEGFEKTVRANPGRAMLELSVAERKLREALRNGAIESADFEKQMKVIDAAKMGLGMGAAEPASEYVKGE